MTFIAFAVDFTDVSFWQHFFCALRCRQHQRKMKIKSFQGNQWHLPDRVIKFNSIQIDCKL